METSPAPSTQEFPGLPAGSAPAPFRRLRICIASYDFVGPVRNGGVGTAFTTLGEALARAGHEVTLYYLSGSFCENQTMAHWIAEYQKKGIRFVPMAEQSALKLGASFHMARSYEAYLWLRSQQFDVIHFSEWRAPGYYSIVAKKQGLAFQNTTLGVNTHGPTLWSLLGNGEYVTQLHELELDFMERQSVKLADVVISPSHYLFRWMKQQNWELAPQSYVHQNILPDNARSGVRATNRKPRAVRELVFFGRLEPRKGLVLLCDALDRLAKETDCKNLKLTLLGKVSKINNQDSQQYLQSRSQKWPWKWEIISNLDQRGAMAYMQGEGRLALIPSQTDNLPYTVMECLGAGVAFLASDIGGIPEMVLPEDRAGILFPLRVQNFAAKILHAVRHGVAPARFDVEPEATERGWLDWHNTLKVDGQDFQLSDNLLSAPLVSVCMSHFNRPTYLRQALDSLRAQDYPNLEVVLVDDASTNPEAIEYVNSLEPEFAQRGWQLIRNAEELFVGAARNLAARNARGEYLMFMDDDNIAKPNEVSVFVSVAQKTNADTVSCCLDFFSTAEPPVANRLPDQRFLFLGPAASASALRNYLGDTNSLFRRDVFLKLGGFHEERSVGHEDWELLGDAILKGYHHEVVPEALVWYRRVNDGTNATVTNSLQRGHMHNIRPYLDAVPSALRPLVLYAQGQIISAQNPQANGEAASQIAYLKLSQRWRGFYEAARELSASQEHEAAAKLRKSALTAASKSNHPFILAEALLAVGAEMRIHNDPDTRQVLQMAVKLARDLKRTADADHAQSLLNTPVANVGATASAKQNSSKPKPAKEIAPQVSIVIPVFNNVLLTQRCLQSLASIGSTVAHEIIVVNNASTDGTTELLKAEAAAGRIRVVTNANNEGFARGCNQGAQAAYGSIVLFINNDTQVTAGWLETLVKAREKANAGVAGAKLLYGNGTIQHAGIEFIRGIPDHPHRNAPADHPEANQARELDMVTGACFMMPRDLFMQLGGFDESYRNGVEDIDLCFRVRAAGRKVIYEPRSVIFHLEGQSAGRFNHVNENLKLFFTRWSKSIDARHRFVVPASPQIIPASKSIFAVSAPAVSAPVAETKSATVSWVGSFLDHGSLSHVNRELVGQLKAVYNGQVQCVSNGGPVAADAEKNWPRLMREVSATPGPNTAVTVRHAWPPNWKRPQTGKLVVIQPWEFGSLPQDWVTAAGAVDEFWLPSNYVRQVYIDSGVPAEKVFVVPNGVDAEKFHPQATPMKLASQKKFKFLFVGGTIGRKGPDVLLQAYLKNFTSADDVCLVIKDFGGKSVYQGQTIEAQIRAIQAVAGAPEILYLNEEMAPELLPGLYTACDCLVMPYRGEGFGLPVVEAMACALPVVVTAGGATDDFVRDEFAYRIPAAKRVLGREVSGMKLVSDGWLLEPDVAKLGEHMRQVFTHPTEARERGRLAAKYARENCSWKNSATIATARLHQLTAAEAPVKASARPIAKLPEVAQVGQLAEARELFAQKKLEAAWTAAITAVGKRPFHPEAFLLLAEIALAAGDGKSARLCAQHARDLAPGWAPAKQFLVKPLKGNAKLDWLDASLITNQASRLSVCLIVKNEERFLAQSLKSVRGLAQQIIVVDTGSKDRTIEIAREFGAEIYSFAWCDDFAAARNAALEYATGDWVLMLDADEELTAAQHAKLHADMKNARTVAFRMPLVNAGQENEGRSFVPRLFRNMPGAYFVGRIHEQVFASLLDSAKKWGLATGLGTAELLHHGYTKALVHDRNKIERNLKLLRAAIEEMPADVNLIMNLGLELVRSDDLAAGIKKYREAYDLMCAQPAADRVPELREVLLTQFTSHLYKVRDHEEVIRILNSPLAKDGGLTGSLHFALGLAHFELKQFSEAADQMRQCLAKRKQPCLTPINTDINTAAPQHCLALCLARHGDKPAAEKAFVAALAETGHVENAKLDYAKFLQNENRPVDALNQLHGIVSANSRNHGAWQLGAEIALGQPEFLEFALEWTGESSKALPENPVIAAQRAEALMINNKPADAAKLWEKIWSCEHQPRTLAALIICEVAAGQPPHAPAASEDERATSTAFVEWYQKLIAARAKSLTGVLNARIEPLSRVLPTAARMLQTALSEADAPVAV